MNELDINVGDFVQVRTNRHKYPGRVGRVIGISIIESIQDFFITVKFSDYESAGYISCELRLLRAVKPKAGEMEVKNG